MNNESIDLCQSKIKALVAEINSLQNELNMPQNARNSFSIAKSSLNKAYKILEDERPLEGQMTIEDLEF